MILLVEDDPLSAAALMKALGRAGFAVDAVATGAAALERLDRPDLDAAVVDMGLPDMDGAAVIAKARQRGVWVPILVVTARSEVDERVRALEAGADDYVVKPFAVAEVVARLRALERRAAAPRWAPLRCGDLRLGLEPAGVTVAGRPVSLSPREFHLLEFLLRRRGEVVTRSQILAEVFGYDFDPHTNLVSVHVAHLRRKIAGGGVAIETVRGFGFRLVCAGESASHATAS